MESENIIKRSQSIINQKSCMNTSHYAENATRRRFLTKNYNKRNSYGKGDYI